MASDIELYKEDSPIKTSGTDNMISQLFFGTVEKTLEESPFLEASMRKPYNPDDIYTKTGDYSIYEEMLNDDQVSVALQVKKDLVLANGFEIITQDEGQEEIQSDIELALTEDPDKSFIEMLEELLTSYEFGFSLSEKIFKKRDDGTLTLRTIKTRHPQTWLIYTDKHGNVDKYVQRGIDGDISVDTKSLIHYINNPRFENPYGRSDLRSAYAAYFIKRQVIRYYGIFLEKASSPVPIARYEDTVPDKTVTAIHDALKKFQTKTCLTIPKTLEVEFIEAKNNGQVFEKALNIFNMFIGRSVLIPDLMGFSGSETSGGSFALGSEQMNIVLRHIQKRRDAIERLVNQHIIKPLVIHNHGFIEHFPKFRLKPISDESALEFAKTFIEAMKGKLYKPSDQEINHFRNSIKFPEGDVEFEKAASPPPFQQGSEASNPEEQEVSPTTEKEVDDLKDEAEQQQDFAKPFKHPETKYHKRVDFKAVENRLESGKNLVLSEMRPVVDLIFEDLYTQIQKKKIIEKKAVEKIDTIKLKNLKTLNNILKKNLSAMYKDGQTMAQKELLKQDFALPVTNTEFLKVLEAETFDYIGDWAYSVNKQARTAMVSAIKDGRPLSSVIDILDNEVKKSSMVSAERFSRTKMTEVMNRGRNEFFESSGIVQGYEYSAILDDRTTEICQGLHGKKFRAGNEPIPPMHFNCRSLLVPITIFEDFKETEKIKGQSPDSFIDDKKGKGFPKQ